MQLACSWREAKEGDPHRPYNKPILSTLGVSSLVLIPFLSKILSSNFVYEKKNGARRTLSL